MDIFCFLYVFHEKDLMKKIRKDLNNISSAKNKSARSTSEIDNINKHFSSNIPILTTSTYFMNSIYFLIFIVFSLLLSLLYY